MADTRNVSAADSTRSGHGGAERQPTTGWAGMVIFAGVIMIVIGIFHAIEGLVAVFDPGYYLVTKGGLVVSVDYTAWGWTHLLIGVLVALTGVGLLAGQTWARVTGIVLAAVSAIVNLAFIAAYPVWTVILVGLDVIVVYALAVHGKEVRS